MISVLTFSLNYLLPLALGGLFSGQGNMSLEAKLVQNRFSAIYHLASLLKKYMYHEKIIPWKFRNAIEKPQ